MLKKDLVEQLSKIHPEYLKRDLDTVVTTVFNTMTDALRSGRRIEIRGFGSMSLHKQKGRDFVNPKTGKFTKCPPNYRIVFKPGRELKTLEDTEDT